jgi:hypothetical protein
MDAVAAFVAAVQAPERMEPRDRPLNDPSGAPQPTAVRGATSVTRPYQVMIESTRPAQATFETRSKSK